MKFFRFIAHIKFKCCKGLTILLLISIGLGKTVYANPIQYFLKPTFDLKTDTAYAFKVPHTEGFTNDSLYQVVSKNGTPIRYYRKVMTEVCQDGECRPLNLKLYWNVTGRYLGFELPKGEFLSKKDHEPFLQRDYEQLNVLLADSLSPLAEVHKEDLAGQPDLSPLSLDAITSATSADISDYVVGGAAYTTYTMWHLVYGSTVRDIERLTEEQFTPQLVAGILNSSDISDQLWALNRLKGYPHLVDTLQNSLVNMIDDSNFTLAERAINVLQAKELGSPLIQKRLVNKFFESDHSVKLLIMDKLKEAPALDMETKEKITDRLYVLKGELLSDVFELYKEKNVSDDKTCRAVAGFLDNDNQFISKKAYDFLAYVQINDEVIKQKMENYRSNRRL